MRILHIWNQAGVSSIISKWQGDNSHVIIQAKHDTFNQGEFYDNEIIQGGRIHFVLAALKKCSSFDIIHLHDAWFMIPLIKMKHPKKKIIMHYHGSMIRRGMKESRRLIWEKMVDQILLSTPDLLSYNYNSKPIYIPNPVDTDHFHITNRKNNGNCLFFPKLGQSKYETIRLLMEYGIDVNLVTPTKVDYKNLPELMKSFEFVCDVSIVNCKLIPANSMMGLQGMSMGIKTIQPDFTIKDTLPVNHTPEFTVKLLSEIYDGL